MAIYNTPDGRQVVGSTVAGNDYHGFNGKRDIIIQLTADGATTGGLNALEYLKAYAVEQNKQNKPIFPNGTRVFISANGYTKAVEADDIVIDGDNITIGGIKWDGATWDYSEAGQGETGLPKVTAYDAGKVLAVNNNGVWGAGVQEYWIPVTASGLELSIPVDKQIEVSGAIGNPDRYWVRGVVISNQYFSGYVSHDFDFIVPLSKSFMRDEFGIDCAGKIHIVYGDPYTVSVEPDKFIVTLTPTALDYSGTMDKTVAEINAAYEAGQEIVFKVTTGADSFVEVPCSAVGQFEQTGYYPNFIAYIIQYVNNVMIVAHTNDTADDMKQTYSTTIYALTTGGVLVVTETAGTLDKTWTEIVTAMSTTGAVLAHYEDGAIDNLAAFQNASVDDRAGEWIVSTGSGINETYIASSASGYPVKQSE